MGKYISEFNFLSEQLDTSGYHWTGEHNFKIRRVVEDFFRDLDTRGLTEDEAQEILRIIYLLGSTKSLAPDGHKLMRNIRWSDFVEGQSKPGDMCRVRLDAFEEVYASLNGKVGSVAGFTPTGQVRVHFKTLGVTVPLNTSDIEVVVRPRF